MDILNLSSLVLGQWKEISDVLENSEPYSKNELIDMLETLSGKSVYIGHFYGVMHGHPLLFSTTLPWIQKRALMLKSLYLKEIPLLLQGKAGQVEVSRELCASILAHCVLGTIETGSESFNEMSFRHFWAARKSLSTVAKHHMVLNYFDQIQDKPLTGSIIFQRHVLELPFTDKDLQATKSPKHVSNDSNYNDKDEIKLHGDIFMNEVFVEDKRASIFDANDCVKVDFANKYLGGGVMHEGAVQEEIMFVQSPECLLGLMICEVMTDNEAISIVGTRAYSKFLGYGRSLVFKGNYDHNSGSNGGEILAIDALRFNHIGDTTQFEIEIMLRELNKAYVGFSSCSKDYECIATGNWGCGVFNGNVQLKFILQWIAASMAGRKIKYFPFGNKDLDHLQDIINSILSSGKNKNGVIVSQLWDAVKKAALQMLNETKPGEGNLFFDHLMSQL